MRNTKAFRERFNAYKNGVSVNKIYDIPKYAGGKAQYDDTIPFLHQYEGFRDSVYLDGKGKKTIGYGFTDNDLINKGRITRDEADLRLVQELDKREKFLSGLKNWDKLTEGAKTALRSYYYNYPAGFKDTTKFMKAWNEGNYFEAIRQVDAGMNDAANPGLRERRLAEQELLKADPFLSPRPAPLTLEPVSTAVRNTIPEESIRYRWTGAEDKSSYVTGKPKLKLPYSPNIPTVVDVAKQSQWNPPGFKDGKRYISNGNGGWDRITDDITADQFANLVVTPNKNRTVGSRKIDPYQEHIRQSVKNAGYVTDQLIEDDRRVKSTVALQGRGELPLERVYPEFDLLLGFGGNRTGAFTRKRRELAREMNKVFDEGLRHANSKSPWVYDAAQVVNPDHVIMTGAKEQAAQKSALGVSNTVNTLAPRQTLGLPQQQTLALPQPQKYIPDPPEATYTGKPATKTIQLDELAHELFGGPIDINARINRPRTLALPESKYSKYVDSEGNVNVRNVVSAIREFYKKHPEARKYKDIINSSGTLDQHTAAVVKSAQEAPVPEGYTRQQLVQAALFHDIGKTLDPTKTHDKKSVQILKELGIDVSPEVQNAIGRHMSSHLGNKDALSKALHFVDVARGENMESAMNNYSYLGYPGINNTKIKPLYKNDTRWQLQNIINPILDRYGYYFTNDEYKKYGIDNHVEGGPVIPLDVSPETARAMVLDKVKQHRTFVRSTYEANGGDWNNLRKQTARQLGKNPKDVTNEEMFRNASEYIKNTDTNSGTQGLPEYLEKFELNPKDYQALYTSSRDATASGYRNGSRPGDSASYLVQMNINDNPDWSLAELWANNEFPIPYTSYRGVEQGTDWRTYELPFRLNTGLDLEKEFKRANLGNEEYNRNAEINARSEAAIKTHEYFGQHPEELNTGLTYFKDTKPTTFLQAKYGRNPIGRKDDIKYWDTTDQYIVDPNNGRFSSADFLQGIQYYPTIDNIGYVPSVSIFTPSSIARVNNILKDTGLSEVYPIMSSDVKTGELNVKYPRAYADFYALIRRIDQMYQDIEKLGANNETEGSRQYGQMLSLLSNLYKRGMLSKKQIDAVNKELRSGKNIQEVFDKYASKKSILQRAKNTYFSDIKQARKKDSFVRRKQLEDEIDRRQFGIFNQKYAELYKAPVLRPIKSKTQFMRDYGVQPDYSYMSPDGYRVFSTERLDNPNPNDTGGNHFVIVGPRGSKQLNIVGDWNPTVESKSHRHGGNYIPGTSRNLGAIGAAIAAGSATLAPRKKKNK